MGNNLDLTSMRYFVHVASSNSFARGAERAHVSPPAVSKAIRKLEQDLGVQLFERTTRKVQLTQAGQVVLARCLRVLADVDGLDAELAASVGKPSGPLRVAAMEVFSIELLPLALSQLVSEHADVVPLCYEMIPSRMYERLLVGDLDVAFTTGAVPMAGIERHALGTSRGVLVCGPTHPLYARARVTSADMQRYASVVPRFFAAEHLPCLDQFPEQRSPRRIGATIELLQMGVELAANGQYLGYFPQISVHKQLLSGRLRALKGLRNGEPFELHALSRADTRLRPAASLLIERVRAVVATIGSAQR